MIYHRSKDSVPRDLVLVSHDGTEFNLRNISSWSIKDGLLFCYGKDAENKTVFRAAFVLRNLITFGWE